jgi:hypothetical protein
MRPSRPPTKVRGFGMVDALVGILVLAAVSLATSQAFQAVSLWDHSESARIDNLTKALDAEPHAAWF